MDYQEMLNARDGASTQKENIAVGTFYKKRIESKYRNVVELRPELTNSLLFCEGLKRDQQQTNDLRDSFQLHYTLNEDSSGIYELELQGPGNIQTLSQLLLNTPAVVAQKGFIEQTIGGLMAAAETLHEKGIYHLCFAPQEIFMRKSDNKPQLLCHGSSFQNMSDSAIIYKDFEDMVAPEVINKEPVDARSDVYALGCFIKKLFDSGDIPMEYKAVVKKATATDPAQRYQSVAEMRQALMAKKRLKHSALLMAAVLGVVAIIIFFLFSLIPDNANVEFIDDTGIRPVDHYAEDIAEPTIDYDPNEYLDPDLEMYMDSIGEMSSEELDALLDSIRPIANAEEMFRRQFTSQAESRLSQLYSQQQMGSSQSDFIAHSQSVMDDLMNQAKQLGERCNLTEEQATLLADQIIARIQAQKQAQVIRYGSMTQGQDEE